MKLALNGGPEERGGQGSVERLAGCWTDDHEVRMWDPVRGWRSSSNDILCGPVMYDRGQTAAAVVVLCWWW